eukprot:TRINITY_DN7852_c0_g1_i1.p1 TRINITY_DN7852_c0_g1~~TRINITY_DN7852_c0_g1_i1.p1  ORF type:complete len:509 (-),score=81.53 TRINITY_DN7852_c0_g1_i1:39-1463(-)
MRDAHFPFLFKHLSFLDFHHIPGFLELFVPRYAHKVKCLTISFRDQSNEIEEMIIRLLRCSSGSLNILFLDFDMKVIRLDKLPSFQNLNELHLGYANSFSKLLAELGSSDIPITKLRISEFNFNEKMEFPINLNKLKTFSFHLHRVKNDEQTRQNLKYFLEMSTGSDSLEEIINLSWTNPYRLPTLISAIECEILQYCYMFNMVGFDRKSQVILSRPVVTALLVFMKMEEIISTFKKAERVKWVILSPDTDNSIIENLPLEHLHIDFRHITHLTTMDVVNLLGRIESVKKGSLEVKQLSFLDKRTLFYKPERVVISLNHFILKCKNLICFETTPELLSHLPFRSTSIIKVILQTPQYQQWKLPPHKHNSDLLKVWFDKIQVLKFRNYPVANPMELTNFLRNLKSYSFSDMRGMSVKFEVTKPPFDLKVCGKYLACEEMIEMNNEVYWKIIEDEAREFKMVHKSFHFKFKIWCDE